MSLYAGCVGPQSPHPSPLCPNDGLHPCRADHGVSDQSFGQGSQGQCASAPATFAWFLTSIFQDICCCQPGRLISFLWFPRHFLRSARPPGCKTELETTKGLNVLIRRFQDFLSNFIQTQDPKPSFLHPIWTWRPRRQQARKQTAIHLKRHERLTGFLQVCDFLFWNVDDLWFRTANFCSLIRFALEGRRSVHLRDWLCARCKAVENCTRVCLWMMMLLIHAKMYSYVFHCPENTVTYVCVQRTIVFTCETLYSCASRKNVCTCVEERRALKYFPHAGRWSLRAQDRLHVCGKAVRY